MSSLKSIDNPVDFKFQNIGDNINTHNADIFLIFQLMVRPNFTRLIPNIDGEFQKILL